MAKEKKAAWWKMFAHQRAAVESVSDKAAGAGLKAAFRYFDGEDIPPGSITPQAFTVFCVIRPYIDEARQDFEKSVTNGRKGAETRWGKDSPPIAPLCPTMGCLREAEAEANISISSSEEIENIPPCVPLPGGGADKPPKPTRKKYGQYGWVKLTESDYNRLLNDLGQTEVERCIAYVDESAQSTSNKNRWRDWNLVVRRCHRDGWGLSQQQETGKGDPYGQYF